MAKNLDIKFDKIQALSPKIDPTKSIIIKTFCLSKKKYAYLYNINKGEPQCDHIFEESELINWLQIHKRINDNLCPKCASVNTVNFGAKFTTEQYQSLFSTFNLKPDKLMGHDPIPEIDGPPPILKEGEMMWHSTTTIGSVPMTSDGERYKYSDYYGKFIQNMRTQNMVQDTSVFKISYIIAYPSKENIDLDKLPLIGMLHGVPGNARWKIRMLRELGKFAVVVAWHMLGMGDSDQILDYKFINNKGKQPNQAWDWKYDVPYVHELMTQWIPSQHGLTPEKKWIFQSDDWGSGIHLRYLEKHNDIILHNFFSNPIWLDGYFVIEIGTIGKLANIRRDNLELFHTAAFGLPQIIIGVEKYMVEERWKMNRYTETDYIYPYQDVDYQSGKTAAEMKPNYWNIAVLADRSSRLAPRQLQPYHDSDNTYGFHPENINTPIDFIWGLKVRVFDFFSNN